MSSKTETVKGLTLSYREGTHDRYIIERVVVENLYGLGPDLVGKSVIDIGAHIGSFSALAASKGARVWAFEPEQGNIAILRDNLAAYPLASIHQVGIRGEGRDELLRLDPIPDVLRMHLHIHSKNSGCHSIFRTDWTPTDLDQERQIQTIDTVTLGYVFDHQDIGQCAFLKMDCEGAEAGILRDIMDPALKLLRRIDAMGVEFHSAADLDWAIPALEQWFYASPVSRWEWRFVKRVIA